MNLCHNNSPGNYETVLLMISDVVVFDLIRFASPDECVNVDADGS